MPTPVLPQDVSFYSIPIPGVQSLQSLQSLLSRPPTYRRLYQFVMSHKNAPPVTPEGSPLQTRSIRSLDNPLKATQRIFGADRAGSPGSSSSVARAPPPRSVAPEALAYLGVSASRPYPQYRGLESALSSTAALSKHDRDIVQEIQNFNSAAGGILRPMAANPFSNITSIPDLLANVERTLEPSIDPLQRPGGMEGKGALDTTSSKCNDGGLNVDPSHSIESARAKTPETFRPRGLSVADINLLNAAYERNGGGKERHAGSSIVTLNSRGRIRREVKFDEGLETKSVFHGADERGDGNVDDDDKSIELEEGIYYLRKDTPGDGNETCYGDKTSEEIENEETPDIEMPFPQESGPVYAGLWPGVFAYGHCQASPLHDVSVSSTRKAAMGLAKELRRLSLAPEDLVIPSISTVDTRDPNLDPDMVGGLPAWEFKRAGLGQFVSAAEVEQQEALLEAYEQGFGPEALSGSSPEEDSGFESRGHLFVYDRMQPRARVAASAVASGSGVGIRRATVPNREVAGVVLPSEEGLEEEAIEEDEEGEAEGGGGEGEENEEGEAEGGGGGGEDEELIFEEQEQFDRTLAMTLENIKHQPIRQGKRSTD